MSSRLPEIAANLLNAVSIFLAARNSVHTWWTGIIGSLLFGYVFFEARLYADVTLQAFFVCTSIWGWWNWSHGGAGESLPIRRTALEVLVGLAVLAIGAAAGYGLLLYRFTNAAAPFFDSIVLVFSVLGQFLLMGRRLENWLSWFLVNTIAVPLYFSRGLHLTSVLYAAFWINAIFGFIRWRRVYSAQT